tara:strand:- start:1210 stop:1410 length:201 start_codon:yes stop_codon:yes gene_type:complete
MSIEGRGRLLEILATMEIPEMRMTRRDWKWMMRNMAINNGEHPDLREAVRLLKEAIGDDNRIIFND